jgi:carbamoyltransferase
MSKDVYILGVSMSNHDRSACLLKNGRITSAIAEERLDRRKRSEGFYGINDRGIVLPPMAAITYVLHHEGISLDEVDLLVCGRSINLCRDVLLTYLPITEDRVVEPPIPGHHLAHAYSAYGTSPFSASAVLVIDEQGHHLQNGKFEKYSWFEGTNGSLIPLCRFEGGMNNLSLGMFYDAFAALTGLSEAGKPAAGKLMGLAPIGKKHPNWPQLIFLDPASGDTVISLEELDSFFELAGLPIRAGMTNFTVEQLDDLLAKYVPVGWGSELGADLARKAQDELEKAVLHICYMLRQQSSYDKLSYAGGVALNCTTNRRLLEAGWSDVYIHPAATDDGAAVGLAMYGWIEVLGNTRQPTKIFNPFTGHHYTRDDVRDALTNFGLQDFAKTVNPSQEGAVRLASGEIICWFQGESEWGPRALGSRSIIANPLVSGIKDRINSTIKYREPFRPFSVSGTAFGIKKAINVHSTPASLAPYMLAVGELTDSRLSEVCHVDGTVRYQTVDPNIQPLWHQLINEFGGQTGIFVVLNTSFNTMGEPLVETPMDAVRQFLISGADALLIEDTLLAASEVSEQVMDKAHALAWALTPVEPLQVALRLEATGYSEAAIKLLERIHYTANSAMSQGPSAVRNFYNLLQRVAWRRGQIDTAYHYAELVLQWSGLPLEAIQAANFIAKYPSGDERYQSLGRLVSAISSPGDALNFFTSILDQNQ